MQCAENANFPRGSIFGDNYTFCFRSPLWLEENQMDPFFCSVREIGTSSLIPSPIQEDLISPFHEGVWELQMEDKISADTKLSKGTSFPPVTKTLFREAFNFLFSQYVAQTKGCLHFFSVKILTFSLLQRFLKYFILNGHIWSLILFNVYLMRFHCSFSTAILLNLFLSFEGKWTEGLNIESLEHFAARKLYYAFCVFFYGIYRDLT